MNTNTAPNRELEQPNWNSTFMSSIAGAAAYYGLQHSASQWFVESGYFSAINIQHDLKPCGPYCWDHSRIVENLASMGLRLTWLQSSGDCRSTEFRNYILDTVRASDADTIFCMAGLEFQLLLQLDEQKFTFALPWGPDVPTCVRDLSIEDWLAGKHFPGVAWFALNPTAVETSPARIRNSLASALLFYEQKALKERSNYHFGATACEQWASKLESSSYDKHGHWWSSMVWSEARKQAAVYFDTHWSGPRELGQSLSADYEELATLIVNSANPDISDAERGDLIRQANNIDSKIYQHLLLCSDCVRESEFN